MRNRTENKIQAMVRFDLRRFYFRGSSPGLTYIDFMSGVPIPS